MALALCRKKNSTECQDHDFFSTNCQPTCHFLQTVNPTSVNNMPQDPGQPLFKNTRIHFVETFFPHMFFLQCAVFFRLWSVLVFSGFSDLKLLLCQWWSRTHCRVFSASFNSFHVHLISFHVHLISFQVLSSPFTFISYPFVFILCPFKSFHVHLISFHFHLMSFQDLQSSLSGTKILSGKHFSYPKIPKQYTQQTKFENGSSQVQLRRCRFWSFNFLKLLPQTRPKHFRSQTSNLQTGNFPHKQHKHKQYTEAT